MNIFLSMAVISVFTFVLGFTIGRRKEREEGRVPDWINNLRGPSVETEDGQPAAPGFARRTILSLCPECDGEKGECVCSDCETPITKVQAEYDHFCATCSYNAARR